MTARLEVPSPTYTLCQTYDSVPAVSHFDFYRVGDLDEIRELGLDESAENGVVIIEWPEPCKLNCYLTTRFGFPSNIGGESSRKGLDCSAWN